MSVIEKVKELWNSNCDDYYITDINTTLYLHFILVKHLNQKMQIKFLNNPKKLFWIGL